MFAPELSGLRAEIASLRAGHVVGRVTSISGHTLRACGLAQSAGLGDRVAITRRSHDVTAHVLNGEILQMDADTALILTEEAPVGVSLGDRVVVERDGDIAPSQSWIGRVIDPFGLPLDGKPLMRGAMPRALRSGPPAASARRAMGPRLDTGMAVFNTMLPLVRGQRVGLFAGSGVGKSSLLGHLGRHMQADVVVFALIGERGRELRDFVETVLGRDGMRRSVVVAATSDRSPLIRRRCAWTAMCVAEHFRDAGAHVLFLADSVTRFAEAHREVAVAAGELPALRGYPASTAHMIMSLCERAGPGAGAQGDITALLSVLVAGSDMDEPVADILRGVLDGHVVMDREIAERGRYPAIDLLRSVSRSLPAAATDDENALISRARALLGAYDRSETMIRAGLYSEGGDATLDEAVRAWPELDAFLAEKEAGAISDSFDRLALMLRRAGSARSHRQQGPASVPPGPPQGDRPALDA